MSLGEVGGCFKLPFKFKLQAQMIGTEQKTVEKRPKTSKARGQRSVSDKSIDITVNAVVSRLGKATIHFYMPIAQVAKEMERKALGLVEGSREGKPNKKEVVPGLRALRQKRALTMN